MSETMEETMKREQEELLATLTRANSALSRLFNVEEGEGKCRICEGNIAFCADCQVEEGESDE
jgi:hypothetical protein